MFEIFHTVQKWIVLAILKTRAPVAEARIIGGGGVAQNVTVAVIKLLRAQCQRGERQGLAEAVAVALRCRSLVQFEY